MLNEGCDTKIYERLNGLEVFQARTEGWMEHQKESIDEFKGDIKDLKKTTIASEIRLGLVIGALVFLAQWLFNRGP